MPRKQRDKQLDKPIKEEQIDKDKLYIIDILGKIYQPYGQEHGFFDLLGTTTTPFCLGKIKKAHLHLYNDVNLNKTYLYHLSYYSFFSF